MNDMKRRIFTWIGLLLFALGASMPVQAQQTEAEIKAHINRVAQSLKTLQCDFVQTKHLKMLGEAMVSKGCMAYAQPDKLSWQYTSPYSYTFILNDNQVLLRNAHRNDVIDVKQNKMFKEIARIMMNSVVGRCLTDERDFRTTIRTEKSEWVATLTPLKKEMRQMFTTIVLHFDRQQSVVTQVELKEKNGDRTIIELRHIKTNQAVAADVFKI